MKVKLREEAEELLKISGMSQYFRSEFYQCIISIIRGGHESAPEGAKRPTAGDEPREFTSRGEGGRVPPFIEKLRINNRSEFARRGDCPIAPTAIRSGTKDFLAADERR